MPPNDGKIKRVNTDLQADPRVYDWHRAEWIATEHAGGCSLIELSQEHPEIVPGPLVIRRWRRDFPAFDLVMQEAERARAECLADQTIVIADDTDLHAAQARNAIQARQWLAARLDVRKYGQQQAPVNTSTDDEPLATYSDAELQAIIRAAHGDVIEMETPGTPPQQQETGVERECGSAPPAPKISGKNHSVTCDETLDDTAVVTVVDGVDTEVDG